MTKRGVLQEKKKKRKEKGYLQGEQLVDQIESQIGFHVLGRHLV
jgi:hypothetical protein